MVLTDGLEVMRTLLSCIHACGTKATDIYLQEKQPEAKLKKLKLSGLTPEMLVLAIDEKRKLGKDICMSPLFSRDSRYYHNRACDFVVLKQSVDVIDVWYIELKSGNPSGYSGQFKSTQCFMRYVFNLATNLCDSSFKMGRERFIVYHTRSGLKKPTQAQSATKPDNPRKIYVKNGQTVSLD
jgi:hypothetical protein